MNIKLKSCVPHGTLPEAPGEELGGTQQSLILGGSIIARSSPLPFIYRF